EIRAVNTIRILRSEDGEVLKKSGFNTDVTGFDKAVSPLLKPIHNGAMILGTGGASLAVAHVFTQKKIPFVFVSRSKNENSILYNQISKQLLHDYPVIVNTTPLGTYPDVDTLPPLPYELLSTDNVLFDLVYNPAKTKFMQMGEQAGATISNGYEMLVAQAEAAWEIWNS
ncbi:MAG TPA: shikimate dehydrogenase, partial [Bacteroidia bacterium]|nr:shikimate dehydrogenase [Bacteroidia bacterium]